MAKVQNSRGRLYEKKSFIVDEPTEHVESEGDRLIKELVQKQLDTNLSLKEELNRRKDFRAAAEFVPLTEYVCGEYSLEEFEKSTKKAELIEELKTLGLSKDEVQIILDSKNEDFQEKYKKTDKSILSSRLLAVLEKIEQAKKESEDKHQRSGLSGVGRHARELALSVKPESERTKLVNFALSCQKPKDDPRPQDHPINQLKIIEDDLFGHLAKKRKSASRIHKLIKRPFVEEPKKASEVSYYYKEGISLWDMKEEHCAPAAEDTKSKKTQHVYTCKPQAQHQYTIRDKNIVQISRTKNPVSPIKKKTKSGEAYVVSDFAVCSIKTLPLEDIQKNRLSVDEIRAIDRFQNYSEGCPSEVLYIKNIAGNVSQEDLVSLFGHFESQSKRRIIYRLMAGRMKGQAFVTFAAPEQAKLALESVNGYILKGKPLVIQYGRTSSCNKSNT